MLVKCPKCELNYMEDTEKMCKVCFREIHGNEPPEEQELCTICNEAAVVPGKVFCAVCLREMNGEKLSSADDAAEEAEPLMTGDETVSTMDEIVPDLNDKDIPEPEYQEIDKNLSLEEMEEQEDEDDSQDDDDDN